MARAAFPAGVARAMMVSEDKQPVFSFQFEVQGLVFMLDFLKKAVTIKVP
jgi:hypothetical protein